MIFSRAGRLEAGASSQQQPGFCKRANRLSMAMTSSMAGVAVARSGDPLNGRPSLKHPQSRAISLQAPLTPSQWDLLLLGCSQASSQIFDLIIVDDDGGLLRPHPSSIRCSSTITTLSHINDNHLDVVSAKTPWPSPSSLIHESLSEIATPVIPTSSLAQHRTAHRRCFTHSFQHPTTTRSLTQPTDASPLTMISSTSIPGSPPDLSGSRSSKSSSSCSDSRDFNHEGIGSDVLNFEDIGLDDDRHGKVDAPRPQPLHRSKTSDATIRSVSAMTPRPALPNLQNHVREAVKQNENRIPTKNATPFASLRRGVSSPITPFTAGTGSARPRSSSPPKRIPTSRSSTTLSDSLHPHLSAARSPLSLAPRRASWQHRKSAKELEEEYNESDEDLPDDAELMERACFAPSG